jgi:precorrin-8X/cobalt-precorrin-8 methylmutase
MSAEYDYARDGAEIYRRSFAIIRSEADLSRFAQDEARVAVRIIHACGMVEIARDLVFGPGFVAAARGALLQGKPIFCDSKMVANGITRARLPAGNEIVCTLDSPGIADRAARLGTTRSAAALDLWLDRLGGSLVAIGNAPTAPLASTPRALPPRSTSGSTISAARWSPSAMRRRPCSVCSS